MASSTLGLDDAGARLSFSSIFTVLVTALCAYTITVSIYYVTFHPLAKFPGPKLAAISAIPWWRKMLVGEGQVAWLLELHEKYGPVVRYHPNHVSYADGRAWREINGMGYEKGRKENPKAKEVNLPSNNGVESIFTQDQETHRRLRRLFVPVFTERALRQQEPLFRRHVDLMVSMMHKTCAATGGSAIFDLTETFAFVTFDIMGDLLFGEPLGLIENSKFSPWVQAVFDAVRLIPLLMMINSYPLLKFLFAALEPKSITEMKRNHFRHTADRVDARLKKGSDQPDIWNLVTEGLTLDEMHSNAEFFMLAGSETASTLLAGYTYYLLTNPDVMKKAVAEIRSTFKTSSEIEMHRLADMKYLNACLQETLRMYPPVPHGVPRVVPEGGQMILGNYVPADTRVSVFHTGIYRSPRYFANPNVYDPERWIVPPAGSEEASVFPYKDDDHDAFQPFGYGPRDCAGKRMAWHEMRLIATKLLLDFDVEMCEESRGWRDQKVFSLWEKKPLMCRITPVSSKV